jgi:hypothetical protein
VVRSLWKLKANVIVISNGYNGSEYSLEKLSGRLVLGPEELDVRRAPGRDNPDLVRDLSTAETSMLKPFKGREGAQVQQDGTRF